MARSFFVPRLFVGSSITRILIDYVLFLYSIHYIHRQEGREQKPCKHNRSDYCISQHCISVIQAAVDRIVISSVQSATLVLNFPFNQRQPYLIFGPLQTMVERSSNGMEKVPSSFIVCCTTWFWNWTTIRHVFCILQEFDAGANTVAQWLKKRRIFTR